MQSERTWNVTKVYTLLLLFVTPLLLIEKPNILLFLNRNQTDYLDIFFKNLSSLGNAFSVVIISIILFTGFKYKYLLQFVLSFCLQLIMVLPLKHIFFNHSYRPRKYLEEYYSDLTINFVEGVRVYNFDTFPSGHTSTIFFIVTFLSICINNKWATWCLFIFGLFVGFSRIYLVQHFFIDVYFGSIFGFSSSLLAYFFMNKYYKNWYDKSLFENAKIPV